MPGDSRCATCEADKLDDSGQCPFCGGQVFYVVPYVSAADDATRYPDGRWRRLRRKPITNYRADRDLSEMLGLAKGLIADGVITDEEVRYFRDWGANHPDALTQWPLSLIFTRVQQFYEDGTINEAERIELHNILAGVVGGTAPIVLGYEGATTLPLDNPPPPIRWYGEVYVFTGKFAYGPREICEREVIDRQGSVAQRVTRRTTFLVIGTFGSKDWAHSTFGRKIQEAVSLRDSGLPLKIVGEDHWAMALAKVAGFS